MVGSLCSDLGINLVEVWFLEAPWVALAWVAGLEILFFNKDPDGVVALAVTPREPPAYLMHLLCSLEQCNETMQTILVLVREIVTKVIALDRVIEEQVLIFMRLNHFPWNATRFSQLDIII